MCQFFKIWGGIYKKLDKCLEMFGDKFEIFFADYGFLASVPTNHLKPGAWARGTMRGVRSRGLGHKLNYIFRSSK